MTVVSVRGGKSGVSRGNVIAALNRPDQLSDQATKTAMAATATIMVRTLSRAQGQSHDQAAHDDSHNQYILTL